MSRWLLDRDPFSGVEQYYLPTPDGKGFTLETVQDVEPILERNKRLQNDGHAQSKEFRHMATIPPIIELKWRKELGIDINNRNHWPAVKRLLNSSEWKWLRTAPGKI